MLKINKDFKPVSPENEYAGIYIKVLKTEIVNNQLAVTYEDENGKENTVYTDIETIPKVNAIDNTIDVNTIDVDMSSDILSSDMNKPEIIGSDYDWIDWNVLTKF